MARSHSVVSLCRALVRRTSVQLRRLRLLAVAMFLAIPVHLARAQSGCFTDDPPCPPNQAPRVSISPAGGTYTTSSVAITVSLDDDGALNPSTLSKSPSITLSGTWATGNTSAELTGTLPLSVGTNTFIVDVADDGGLHGADTVTFTYAPPPPPASQDSAVLSLAPYSTSTRTLIGCSGCLYGAAGYATPAYISRDTPRSVTLAYSSAQAEPRGLVQVDATINATTIPTAISLQLVQGGTSATLTNGGTAAWYTGDTGTVRLAAQLDASSLATGVYDYTAVVKTWWCGTSYQSQLPVRVLVINAQGSPEGAGWTIAGLQRLVSAGGDSVAIADGSGHLTFPALPAEWLRRTRSVVGRCLHKSAHIRSHLARRVASI